jgi:hypothetical protein
MPVDVLTSVAMVLVYDKERNDMVAEAEACREMGGSTDSNDKSHKM